jgi:hypothetical protein
MASICTYLCVCVCVCVCVCMCMNVCHVLGHALVGLVTNLCTRNRRPVLGTEKQHATLTPAEFYTTPGISCLGPDFVWRGLSCAAHFQRCCCSSPVLGAEARAVVKAIKRCKVL